jgi:hypothetical protein
MISRNLLSLVNIAEFGGEHGQTPKIRVGFNLANRGVLFELNRRIL